MMQIRQKIDFLQVFRLGLRALHVFVGLSTVLTLTLAGFQALADETPGGQASLAEIQVVTGAGEPKIRLFTTDPIALSGAIAEGPDRLVMAIPSIRNRLAERKKFFETGPISSYEIFTPADGDAKIEFNLRELLAPVQVTREPVANGAAYASTVLLRHVDRREFTRLAKLGREERPVFTTSSKQDGNLEQERRPLIVIDPGHGGSDTGAQGLGDVLEKDIVFAFSKALVKSLEQTGAVRARLTRETDQFVALDKRVEIARAMGADYFISIHADTIAATAEVRGMTVYVGSDRASDAEAARLADSENKADLAGGVVATKTEEAVAGILGDLMMRETRTRSAGLAHAIIGRMTEAPALNKNPIRAAAFRVLRAPDFPSVLVELGYISSPTDIGLLTSDTWMGKAADSLTGAILTYLSSAKSTTKSTAKPMPPLAAEP